jgi:hypothetical protein
MKRHIATNDRLIEEFISDPTYSVREDGTIWRLDRDVWKQTGKAKTKKRGKQYHHLKYQGSMLVVHRIIYRRFVGNLDKYLVVNHIDGNSFNNTPTNLELVTQSINMYHRSNGWD